MSFVNQGNYNDACQYYLRGLNLNPEAVHVWNYLRTALSLLDRMVCAPVALPVSPFADATRVLRIWWRRAIRTTLKRSRGSLTLPDLSKCVDVQWTFVIRRSYLLRHACDQIPDACERRGGEAARGAGARALSPEARRRRAAHAAPRPADPGGASQEGGLAPSAPRRACGRGSHRRGCRGGCPRRYRTRAPLPARPSPLRQRWTREAAAGRAQAPHKLLPLPLSSLERAAQTAATWHW